MNLIRNWLTSGPYILLERYFNPLCIDTHIVYIGSIEHKILYWVLYRDRRR